MASITNRKGKYYVVYWFDSFDGKRKQKWEQCENYEEAIFKQHNIFLFYLKRRRLKMK